MREKETGVCVELIKKKKFLKSGKRKRLSKKKMTDSILTVADKLF